MSGVEVLVALAILVGIAGVVVPVLPGPLLVLVAVLGWAWSVGTATAWSVFAVAAVVLVVAAVVKYVVPGRSLQAAGVPARTLWAGAGLGIAGFFLVPVLGLFLGFVAGVYLAERHRLGGGRAWPSTRLALRSVGVSILIELAGTLLAAGAWVVGVAIT